MASGRSFNAVTRTEAHRRTVACSMEFLREPVIAIRRIVDSQMERISMQQKPYREFVADAEAAVSGVKDPDLRRVAFEKVLSDLLISGDSVPSATKKRRVGKSAKKAVVRPANGTKGTRTGPMSYLEELVADKFFNKQKTIADVRVELQNRGHHIPLSSLSGPLQKLCQRRCLRRQKLDEEGNKHFVYSNW
jgi:hypothetical protein